MLEIMEERSVRLRYIDDRRISAPLEEEITAGHVKNLLQKDHGEPLFTLMLP